MQTSKSFVSSVIVLSRETWTLTKEDNRYLRDVFFVTDAKTPSKRKAHNPLVLNINQ